MKLNFLKFLLIGLSFLSAFSSYNACADNNAPIRLSEFCEKENDDSTCLQNALNFAAKNSEGFGSIIVDQKRVFNITKTLIICNSSDGVFDGMGASFNWMGPRDVPMFLIINGRHMRFQNFNIFSSSKGPLHPLLTGMEFTSDLTNKKSGCTGNVIPSSKNSIDHVRMEGKELNGLIYGIRFTNRFGDDANNDMSTIFDVTLNNITRAAVSIEHSQSHQHRLISVNGYGAPGNNGCFVDAKTGFTSVVGGFQGGWGDANFCFDGAYGQFSITDTNSEGSRRLIEVGHPNDVAGFPMNIAIQGGRFAINGLHNDGNFVSINRLGVFSIRNVLIDGKSENGKMPKIIIFPGRSASDNVSRASLTVDSISFYVQNVKLENPISVSKFVQFNRQNINCYDEQRRTTIQCPSIENF